MQFDNENSGRLFGKLTAQNWLELNHTSDHIVRINSDHTTSKITEQEWTEKFLSIVLDPSVPREVHDLYEVAQGTMCYGCFFYPLYTAGSTQLYRVLEAALFHRREQMDLEKKKLTFFAMTDDLHQHGIISDDHFPRWQAGRRLRNLYSHAKSQSLESPDMAANNLYVSAELIDALFLEEGESLPPGQNP
tara:strand:+ start:185 stop:754 length:570 start_codon:yes stop_codon:yes gene_type:complete